MVFRQSFNPHILLSLPPPLLNLLMVTRKEHFWHAHFLTLVFKNFWTSVDVWASDAAFFE
jgi:hypothetical protein